MRFTTTWGQVAHGHFGPGVLVNPYLSTFVFWGGRFYHCSFLGFLGFPTFEFRAFFVPLFFCGTEYTSKRCIVTLGSSLSVGVLKGSQPSPEVCGRVRLLAGDLVAAAQSGGHHLGEFVPHFQASMPMSFGILAASCRAAPLKNTNPYSSP